MEKKYQFFISSTFTDLENERLEVINAILKTKNIPLGMESFTAQNKAQFDVIKNIIKEVDYYLVIIGGRYGSIHPDFGLSYTELEYDYAIKMGIPVAAFIQNEDVITLAKTDSENSLKLKAFKDKVKNKMCDHWNSIDGLGKVVTQSIFQLILEEPRSGWIKYDDMKNEISTSLHTTKEKKNFDIKLSDLINEYEKEVRNFSYLNSHGSDVFKTIFMEFLECYNEISYYIECFIKIPDKASAFFAEDKQAYLEFLMDLKIENKLSGIEDQVYLIQMVKVDIAYSILFYGVNNLDFLLGNLKEKYSEKFLKSLLNFISLKTRKDTDIPWNSFLEILKEKVMTQNYKTLLYSLTNNYKNSEKYYIGHDNILSKFFRTIYNIYKNIDEENISNKEKYKISKVLRTKFTNSIESLIFINSLTSIGIVWELKSNINFKTGEPYNLVSKYEIIKNIPKHFISDLEFQKYYSNINYEFQANKF